jgi:hypothetical protein
LSGRLPVPFLLFSLSLPVIYLLTLYISPSPLVHGPRQPVAEKDRAVGNRRRNKTEGFQPCPDRHQTNLLLQRRRRRLGKWEETARW